MDEIRNNKIFWWGKVFLIVLSVFFVVKVLAELKAIDYIGGNPASAGSISVSGKGEILATPDIASFSFTGREEAKTVSEAQSKTAEKVNTAIKFLKENGVAEKDIKTGGYNIYPKYEYSKPEVYCMSGIDCYYPYGKQRIYAYEVSQTVEVKVRKIDEAGKILAGIGNTEVSEISSLSLTNENYTELAREARAKAIEDAQNQAKSLAKDLGVKLVRITSFSEGGAYPMYFDRMAMGKGGGEATPSSLPEIPVGENKIVSNVTITYEIR